MTIIMKTAAAVRMKAIHMATIGVTAMKKGEMKMMMMEMDMVSLEKYRIGQ